MRARILSGTFLKVVAIFCGKGQTVDSLELFDFFQGILGKGGFTFESVKHDPFEEIAEGHVSQLGNGLQNFQEPFFEADTRLNALDFDIGHWYICTSVMMEGKSFCCKPASLSRRGLNEGSQAF